VQKTIVSIPKMDCPSEEQLVRTALSGHTTIARVLVDLTTREVTVVHEGDADGIAAALTALNLGARVTRTEAASALEALASPSAAEETRALRWVLIINAVMFVAELTGAYLAESSALLADSLDMFADAAVYALALFGIHRARTTQLRAAHLSGWLQLALALLAMAEVVRRAVFGSEPEAPLMVVVAIAALIANAASMALLSRHRQGGAHMKASWIFTTTDVLANLGVIAAAILVRVLGSNVPDLVVAAAIAFLVLSGAIRILRLR
jgi:Co/Zn/Cd efflux system component